MSSKANLWTLAVLALSGCAAPHVASEAPHDVPSVEVGAQPFGPELRDARAVATDPQGRIYVADAGADVVYRLGPDGHFATSLGGPGSGDYAFLTPTGIDPTNGLVLYVADAGNGRVQRFSHEDRLLESIIVPADLLVHLGTRARDAERGRPVAVAAAPTGEVFAIEANRGIVMKWDERRQVERVIGTPAEGRGALRDPVALATLRDGRLLVADAGHAAILVYDPYGEFLRRLADGTAQGVRDVVVVEDRIVVVLPRQLLLYDAEGLLLTSLRPDIPDPIVSAAATSEGLIVVTRGRLWRLTLPTL